MNEEITKNIYISGHRNPDLDSLCSAYAYAVLKNQVDPQHHYIAIRCGHLSDSAKKIFANLEISAPPYRSNIFPMVSDVVLTSGEHIQADALLSDLADSYSDANPSAIPIFEGNHFYGLLSIDDISDWMMKKLAEHKKIDEVPKIRDLMREQEAPIMADEMFEEAKAKLSSSKKRGLAVVGEDGYVGYVTRRCFLKVPKHNLILVDHNEPRQSIMGVETANIVEIIDHHRLDAVKTDLPIFIDAEPLGSTCTIVYQQYRMHGIVPDEITAKVLLTGMISDTLILRSPTTTAIDVKAAHELAEICKVDLQEFGLSMYSCMEGLKNRSPEDAIGSDFKMYNEKGVKFGIGQCEVTTLHDLPDYKEIYLSKLDEFRQKNGLDWAVLMITDVLKEDSVLLVTDYKANRNLQYQQHSNRIYDMPGVMSRKKQLLPAVLFALGL